MAVARRVHEGAVLLEDAFGLKRFLDVDRTAPGRWVKAILSLDSAGLLSVFAPHESDFAKSSGYPTGSPTARPLLLRFRLDAESEVHSSDDTSLANCIQLHNLAQGPGVADAQSLRFRTSRFTSELKWLKKIGSVLDDLPTFWYIRDDKGNVLGPHGLVEMREWIEDGLIAMGDNVRTEDRLGRAGEWTPVETTALMRGWEMEQHLTTSDVRAWARGGMDLGASDNPMVLRRYVAREQAASAAEKTKKKGGLSMLKSALKGALSKHLTSRKKKGVRMAPSGKLATASGEEFAFTMTNVQKVVLDDPSLRMAAEQALLAEVDATVAASEAMEAMDVPCGDGARGASRTATLLLEEAHAKSREARAVSRRLSVMVERRLSNAMPTAAQLSALAEGDAKDSASGESDAFDDGFGSALLADFDGVRSSFLLFAILLFAHLFFCLYIDDRSRRTTSRSPRRRERTTPSSRRGRRTRSWRCRTRG